MNEEQRKWPVYRVATQLEEGEEVFIRTIRCENVGELHKFLRRIYSLTNLAMFNFLEIHEMLPKGHVALVHESRKPWPKNVREIRIDGIICPKLPKNEPVSQRSTETKILTPPNFDEVVKNLADGATTIVTPSMTPDEQGRPFRIYKLETA